MDYLKIQNDFPISILKTDKFKSTKIKITFASHIDKDTVTKRALLAYMMRITTQKYNTRQKLNEQLESMYQTYLSSHVDKRGLTHFVAFDMQFIDNEYVLYNENLFDEALSLLEEVIYHPNLTEQSLKEELRLMKEYHMNQYSNKMRYALKESLKIVHKDDPYMISAMGNEEDLESITLNDVKQAYQDMLDNDYMTVSIVTSLDSDYVTNLIHKHLHHKNQKFDYTLIDKNRVHKISNVDKEVVKDIKQSKLVVYFDLEVFYKTKDYYKAAVFNSLLGGGSESLLFNKIREELSLCYFIGSVYDQYKGSLVVYAGTDHKNKELLLESVEKEIQKIIDLEIPLETLEITKTAIINSYNESYDSLSSLTNRIHEISLFDRTFSQTKVIEEVRKITLEDMKEIALKLTKQLTYELRGDDDE